jgi:hypothetical protein
MARPVSDEQWHALLEDAGLVLRAWTRPGSWSWCDQYEQLVPVSRILWWAPPDALPSAQRRTPPIPVSRCLYDVG